MKTACQLNGILFVAIWFGMVRATAAPDPLALEIRNRNGQWEISWPSTLALPLSVSVGVYELQSSDDLKNWTPVGPPIRGTPGIAGEALRHLTAGQGGRAFYRVAGRVETTAETGTGAEVFGYSSAFAQEINRLGFISPAAFATLFPEPNYLEHD